MAGQNPQLPDQTWPITKDDKVQIQELGRKLNDFLHEHFKGKESVHLKIIAGGFQYIMGLQEQKIKLIGDDFILTDKAAANFNLKDRIEEPFTVAPDEPEPTVEERKKFLQDELAKLDAETASTEEVADASPAPSASATPAADAPVDGPTNG